MRLLFSLLLLLILTGFAHAQTQKAASKPVTQEKLTHKIFPNPDKSFGYDIYRDGKLLVHQPSIPGRQGLSGFKTKTDAEKVAALVIKKIRKGMMPPTVEEKELKALKI